MRQQNSVFHSILKLLPWDEFERVIKNRGAGDAARDFTHSSHLVAMLYAQLAGAVSLRDIEAGLSSHANRLYHLHATPPKRATLAEANSNRPVEIYSDLLAVMIQRSHRKLRQAMDGVTYLIDSTGLALNALSRRWTQFSANVCGAKLHVVYDPIADCPVYTAFSPANTNNITAAQIELFFRWVKQTLKIKKFLGVSENAVRIQIAVALIAFLLLRLAQQSQAVITSPLMYARLIRANLMHLRGLGELHKPPERTKPVLGQGILI